MQLCRVSLAVVLVSLWLAPAGAQQPPSVKVDGDDITIRGCVRQAGTLPQTAPEMLVWSRSDIMMAGVTAAGPNAPSPVGTTGVAGRVVYWLDDEEDLAKYVGQEVEIEGELDDFEEGQIEIERHGEFVEIELDLDGKEEKARVPISWLGQTVVDEEREIDIVARRIDVESVRVLGACKLP